MFFVFWCKLCVSSVLYQFYGLWHRSFSVDDILLIYLFSPFLPNVYLLCETILIPSYCFDAYWKSSLVIFLTLSKKPFKIYLIAHSLTEKVCIYQIITATCEESLKNCSNFDRWQGHNLFLLCNEIWILTFAKVKIL